MTAAAHRRGDQPRTAAGVPAGGEFATHDRSESAVTLTSREAPTGAQLRLLALLARYDRIDIDGPGPKPTKWDHSLVVHLRAGDVYELKVDPNPHAVQQLIDDGLLRIAAEKGSWPNAERRVSRQLAFTDTAHAALAAGAPLPLTPTVTALAYASTGAVLSDGRGPDERMLIRTPTLDRLVREGLLARADGRTVLTAAGYAALAEEGEAVDAAAITVSTTIAHDADFGSRVRGGRAWGRGATLRAGTARCRCEWTYDGNESLAVARQAHADHVRTETLRALAAARVG